MRVVLELLRAFSFFPVPLHRQWSLDWTYSSPAQSACPSPSASKWSSSEYKAGSESATSASYPRCTQYEGRCRANKKLHWQFFAVRRCSFPKCSLRSDPCTPRCAAPAQDLSFFQCHHLGFICFFSYPYGQSHRQWKVSSSPGKLSDTYLIDCSKCQYPGSTLPVSSLLGC